MGFHGWNETIPRGQFIWLIFFFLLLLFLSVKCFSLVQIFLFLGTIFLSFFFGPPLTPSCLFGSSYLPQPIYLLHLANLFPIHLFLCSFLSLELPSQREFEYLIVVGIRNPHEFQRLGVLGMPQQEKLQGGGRSGSLKVSSLLLLLSYFFVAKKMITMSLLSSFISFHYYEEENNNNTIVVVVVFFFFCYKETLFFSQHNTTLFGLGK